jgi:RNA polymerase sigma factor (sigma-70 family)
VARDLLTGTEREALAKAGRQRRRRDRELAGALHRPRPTGPTPSAAYLRGVTRSRPLSPEEERRLLTAAKAGDLAARAQVVERFLPLVASTARTYRGSPAVEPIELMQEGVVGLLRAVERFDVDRGTRFAAYAGWWVRQAMQQLIAELTRPTVLSDRALRDLARLRDAHLALTVEAGREPSPAELAERVGFVPSHVEDLLSADRPARSLDETLLGGDGAVGTFGELLADPLAEGEYERVVSEIAAEELGALLTSLSERERAVLRWRYGVGRPQESLRKVASRLGVSAERVRQLEERALGKLRVAAGVDAA